MCCALVWMGCAVPVPTVNAVTINILVMGGTGVWGNFVHFDSNPFCRCTRIAIEGLRFDHMVCPREQIKSKLPTCVPPLDVIVVVVVVTV